MARRGSVILLLEGKGEIKYHITIRTRVGRGGDIVGEGRGDRSGPGGGH